MKFLLQSIALLIVALCAIYLLNENRKLKNVHQGVDTVEYIETIPYLKPIPVDSVILRYETVKLPVSDNKLPDSVHKLPDSVQVQIPIQQKIYEDSSYTAYVSGYNPSLDSIFIYPRHDVITITKIAKEKRKRWNIGIQAGYGYTPKGFQPYVGIGGSYNF